MLSFMKLLVRPKNRKHFSLNFQRGDSMIKLNCDLTDFGMTSEGGFGIVYGK